MAKRKPLPHQPATIIRRTKDKSFGRSNDTSFQTSGSFAGSQFRKDAVDGKSSS